MFYNTVIYIRCREDDSILAQKSYGPIAFSHYNMTRNSSEIIIVTAFNGGLCADIHEARLEFLKKINPNAKITTLGTSSTVYQDFRILAFAPTLFTDLSTFGLAAGLIGNGTVHSPPLFDSHITFNTPDWVWSTAPLF